MKFKMQILMENDDGDSILLAENIEFERKNSSVENLGLSLAESKELLRKTQQTMVREQVSQPVSMDAEGVSANEPSVEDPARPRRGRRRRPYGKHERPAATELVFVETDPNRIPSPEPIQNALENPDVQRDRPARRRNRELPPSEPLMQVETQKSDSIN